MLVFKDGWIGCYKVLAEEWYDHEHIYLNVQYFAPGSNIEKPPVWDKSVYIKDTEKARQMVRDYIHSLVNFVAQMEIKPGYRVVITL
jgi:hypothetical protein